MEPKYLPVAQRAIDTQYKDCLRIIREKGELVKHPFQTEGRYTLLTLPPMIYKFSNGFPMLTERKIGFWRKPIQELFAFINGVRDAKVLAEEWGVNWWMEKWATPEKCADFDLPPYDMGPGSYGASLHDYPHFEKGKDGFWYPKPFNQYEHLVKQVRKYPGMASHMVTTWIPAYTLEIEGEKRKVVVAPCHGNVEVTIINDKLTLRMDQRSDDFPIGHPSNMIQYAALTLAMAHVTGYEPYMFIHAPHNAQIYERHMNDVDELLKRQSHVFPTMRLTEEGKQLTSIFDFRAKHFELSDYTSEPAMELEDAVI